MPGPDDVVFSVKIVAEPAELDHGAGARGVAALDAGGAVHELTALFTALFARDMGNSSSGVDAGFVGDAEDELDKLFGG